jgi:hypothetical protein
MHAGNGGGLKQKGRERKGRRGEEERKRERHARNKNNLPTLPAFIPSLFVFVLPSL